MNSKRCEMCGDVGDVVDVLCTTGDIVTICRHGHFEGAAYDPWTGVFRRFTGPLHLGALEYYPEGWIERLKARFAAGGAGPYEASRCAVMVMEAE